MTPKFLSRCITLGAIAAGHRLAEERRNKDEPLQELREELREERHRADQRVAEEPRRADENQQTLLATIADLTVRNDGGGSLDEP